MNSVFFGLALLAGVLVLFQGLGKSIPPALAMKRAAGAALMALAVALFVSGRGMLVAIPIFLFALALSGEAAGGYARFVEPFLGRWGQLFDLGRRSGSHRRSAMRAAAIEMELDHDSGALTGRVLSGRYRGTELSRLSSADLMALWREIASDLESRSLLEAYLDRRQPLWRQNADADTAAGGARAARSGSMTDDEAHQVLGLGPGASEAEVREAHRRLMKAVHPDMGGSTFLAAKINEAKDRLVGKHRDRSNH